MMWLSKAMISQSLKRQIKYTLELKFKLLKRSLFKGIWLQG